MICPLCSLTNSTLYEEDKKRHYFQCESCQLVFVPRTEVLSEDLEKKRYEAHDNDASDAGYVEYLTKIVESITPFLHEYSKGLDFGCGKSMLLAKILKAKKIECSSYDLFFHPNVEVLNGKYDFIVLSEVIEHLRFPSNELTQLTSLLQNDGMLFIKTKLLPKKEDFSSWFYKRDLTHIQFFSEESFHALSGLFGLSSAQRVGEDLYLFRNNRS